MLPVYAGIPWLGFVVYPTHRLVKARKVRTAHRRLRVRLADYHRAGDLRDRSSINVLRRGWAAHGDLIGELRGLFAGARWFTHRRLAVLLLVNHGQFLLMLAPSLASDAIYNEVRRCAT